MKKKTKACPFCWEEILAVAKKCKHCGEFLENKEEEIEKKSNWCLKFIWIILLWVVGIFIISFIAYLVDDKPSSKSSRTYTTTTTVTDNTPREYKNALKTAESYLRSWDFSEKRLREQLAYEWFSADAISYAIKNVDADYMKECLWSANGYLRSSNMSKQRLIEQLRYEWFLDEEINYAINQIIW